MNIKKRVFVIAVGLLLFSGCAAQSSSNTEVASTAEEVAATNESSTTPITSDSGTTEDTIENQSGILLFNKGFSNGQNRISLLRLNTQTGSSEYFNDFTLPTDVGASRLLDYPKFIRRQAFDSEYQVITATKTMTDDQAIHMGYLSSDGIFTDVTEQITEKSGSFSEERIKQYSPVFGPDNYLYFIEELETIELKRVPLNNLLASAVETVRSNLVASTPLYYFDSQENLIILDESDKENAVFYTDSDNISTRKWYTNSEKTNAILLDRDGDVFYSDSGLGSYNDYYGDLIGFVDETSYLLADEGQVYLCQTFEANSISNKEDLDSPENWHTSDGEFRSMAIKELIPENERENWNFIYSNEDKFVYFFSRQKGMEAKTELFKVGLEGSEPEKVAVISIDSQLFSFDDWRVLSAW